MARDKRRGADPYYEEEQYVSRRPRRRGLGATISMALLYILAVVGISILLACVCWIAANDVLALNKPPKTVTISIAQEDTFSDVVDRLEEEGLIEYKFLFNLFASVTGGEEKVTMGTYTLNTDMDYRALLAGMSMNSATKAEVTITIPEGYTVAQIFHLL